MFNNVAFDIAIGLIFIYLVYSLLATAINEFVAMIFAYRHRMLEKGIEQMLDGKNYSYYWWDKALNIIRWVFTYPSIQKKFKEGVTRVNPGLLADQDPTKAKAEMPEVKLSFRQFLSNKKINIAAPQDKAGTVPGKALINIPDAYISRAKLNKKAHLFAANITDHPLYRRKSEQSILFKKPAYLEAATFVDILMDVIGGNKSQTGNSPVSTDDVKKFISEGLNDNPDLKNILNLYLEKAEDDIKKFRILLENWYDDTMARVSGWYKRQVTKILFVIGMILAMAFKVSTIDVVRKLSEDKDARQAMVQNAADYVRTHNISTPAKGGDTSASAAADSTASTQAHAKESAAGKDQKDSTAAAFNEARDKLNNIKQLYSESVAQSDSLLGFGWGDYMSADDRLKLKAASEQYAKDTAAFHKDSTAYLKARGKAPAHTGPRGPGTLDKTLYILVETVRTPRNLIGFLLTALAISLGAPFWFDLLNKFVNVRAGGNNPAEKK